MVDIFDGIDEDYLVPTKAGEHHPKDLEALMHSIQSGRACCLFVRCLRVRRARRADTRQALRGPSDSQT
jgi:hypothetical protein